METISGASRIRRVSLVAAGFLLVLGGWSSAIGADEGKVSLNALIDETQIQSESPNKLELVWWIPEQYWQIVLAEDPNMTPAQVQEVVEVLDPYVVVAVVSGTVGPFGGAQYQSEQDIRTGLRVKIQDGATYDPLVEDQISADAQNLLAAMKPALANLLGPMGENMHFYLFPATTEQGERIADAKSEGVFAVQLGEENYRWRLPLGSLLPRKSCPKCQEALNGAYKFCPWDGTELPAPAAEVQGG